jgi:hypothetical protein
MAARDHAVRTASPPCPGSADNIIVLVGGPFNEEVG